MRTHCTKHSQLKRTLQLFSCLYCGSNSHVISLVFFWARAFHSKDNLEKDKHNCSFPIQNEDIMTRPLLLVACFAFLIGGVMMPI